MSSIPIVPSPRRRRDEARPDRAASVGSGAPREDEDGMISVGRRASERREEKTKVKEATGGEVEVNAVAED
eukprot:1097674-Pyramimonas_sp.AAC.1